MVEAAKHVTINCLSLCYFPCGLVALLFIITFSLISSFVVFLSSLLSFHLFWLLFFITAFLFHHLLLYIFQFFDCLWNEIDTLHSQFLPLHVASAIFACFWTNSFHMAVHWLLWIVAWACCATALIQSMWKHFAFSFPTACSNRTFFVLLAPT